MKIILNLLILACLVYQIVGLTAQQVSNNCHCDLTVSFCDFNCCCDTDCSTAIAPECFYSLSSLFCINSTYYFKIDSTLTPSSTNTGCYYYNSSTTLQEEVVISEKQVNNIVADSQITAPITTTPIKIEKGYRIGDALYFSNQFSFYFVDSLGQCITTNAGTLQSSIKYRMNMDITCSASSQNINIFNSIFGKSVPSYSFSNDTLISVPAPEGSYTQATVYFFIARLGSSNIEYIQSIKTVGKNVQNSLVRTLRVRFMDAQVELEQEEGSPSFFPQIPYDIFYPIYQIAYSY